MLASMTQLHELTGFDRRTVKIRLNDAGLVAIPGERGAMLYDTRDALPILYAGGFDEVDYDLTTERARLAHHQANNEALKERAARGELIAATLVVEYVGSVISSAKTKILAAHNKIRNRHPGIEAAAIDDLQNILTEALEELAADGIPPKIRESISTDTSGMDTAAESDD